ncbi:hypothetical protein [Staphylococcus shinii]
MANNNGQNNNVEETEFTEESQNINQEQEENRPKKTEIEHEDSEE